MNLLDLIETFNSTISKLLLKKEGHELNYVLILEYINMAQLTLYNGILEGVVIGEDKSSDNRYW